MWICPFTHACKLHMLASYDMVVKEAWCVFIHCLWVVDPPSTTSSRRLRRGIWDTLAVCGTHVGVLLWNRVTVLLPLSLFCPFVQHPLLREVSTLHIQNSQLSLCFIQVVYWESE